jgi:hypothetical protein
MENSRKPTRGLLNIRDLFVCDCGVPLARKTGLFSYEIFKEHGRERVKIEIDIESGGIRCTVCKRGPSHVKIPAVIRVFDIATTAAGFGLSTTAAGVRFADTCAGGVQY